MFRLEFGGGFPWVRKHVGCDTGCWQRHKAFVWLPDGRMGVIDHLKTDGKFGVRPLDGGGNYCRNTSTHWSDEDRLKIPEEIAFDAAILKPVDHRDIPHRFRRTISE